mmetsp:Transcript_42752/g.84251  ORF Transcript_42752/g.84251 Transcript_42752/m.84251 type:complete len:213 (-) Transcript_42752:666-1304(-)
MVPTRFTSNTRNALLKRLLKLSTSATTFAASLSFASCSFAAAALAFPFSAFAAASIALSDAVAAASLFILASFVLAAFAFRGSTNRTWHALWLRSSFSNRSISFKPSDPPTKGFPATSTSKQPRVMPSFWACPPACTFDTCPSSLTNMPVFCVRLSTQRVPFTAMATSASASRRTSMGMFRKKVTNSWSETSPSLFSSTLAKRSSHCAGGSE